MFDERELEIRLQKLELIVNSLVGVMSSKGLTLDSLSDSSDVYSLVRKEAITDGFPSAVMNPENGNLIPAQALDTVSQLGSGENLDIVTENDMDKISTDKINSGRRLRTINPSFEDADANGRAINWTLLNATRVIDAADINGRYSIKFTN